MVHRHLLRAALLLAASFAFAAGDPSWPAQPRYVFEHARAPQLATKSVTALAQDRAGFLWIATQDGVLRYDGETAEYFGAEAGVVGGFVDQLVIAPDGTVWFANRRGAFKFDPATKHFDLWPIGLIDPDPRGAPGMLAFDRSGHAYLAQSNGIVTFEPGRAGSARLLGEKEGLPKGRFEALLAARDGSLWFAAGGRAGRLVKGRAELLPAAAGVPEDPAVVLLEDGAGAIWIRTQRHLLKRAPGSDRFVRDDDGLPVANDFGAPSLDARGELLVPTVQGLFFRRDGQWRHVNARQGMTSDAVYAVLEDREGALWLGFGGAGVDRWPGWRAWSGWTKEEGLPDNVVWATARDGLGRLWVATNTGLAMWDAKAGDWKIFRRMDGLPGETIRALAVGPDGAIWALAYPGGVARIDPATLKIEKAAVAKPGERDPTSIGIARDGSVWLGAREYIRRIVREARKLRVEEVALPEEVRGCTSGIGFAPDGTLWSSGRKGVARFDGRVWRHFGQSDGLKLDFVSEITALSGSDVWLVYYEGAGLTHLTLKDGKPQVKHLTVADGLRTERGYMLGHDRGGRIWLGGDEGVNLIAPDETIRQLDRADGLLWNDVSAGGFREEPDGAILIGTSGGLARYLPAADRDRPPVNVALTGVRFGQREALGVAKPEVAYDQRSFTAQFSPMTFRSPAEAKCRYRLNGLESDYQQTTQRMVRYPVLPSGSYTFEVMCRDGQRWGAPATVSFTVLPAWWQRWWARGLFLLAFCALMWGIVVLRTGYLEAERRKLEAAVAHARADIKTLRGLLPICAACKKVRDDKGYWEHIESYVKQHSEASFTHGICPDCAARLYPEENPYAKKS